MDRTNQMLTLGIVAGVVIIVFALIYWFMPAPRVKPTGPLTQEQLVKSDSPMTGRADAKVTLVEWGDYQCPSCAALAPVIEQIIEKYGANPDFNFVFRNFPLGQHPHARLAAEAALAAGAQSKYWEMYELLYAHQSEWSPLSNPREKFVEFAKQIGLDEGAFTDALDNHTYAPQVSADLDDAITLVLDHTPTLFINGVEQVDVSLAGLTAQIDAALK